MHLITLHIRLESGTLEVVCCKRQVKAISSTIDPKEMRVAKEMMVRLVCRTGVKVCREFGPGGIRISNVPEHQQH